MFGAECLLAICIAVQIGEIICGKQDAAANIWGTIKSNVKADISKVFMSVSPRNTHIMVKYKNGNLVSKLCFFNWTVKICKLTYNIQNVLNKHFEYFYDLL